jgi:putative ABC transport system ATP-binding protein
MAVAPLVQAREVAHTYGRGEDAVAALRSVDLDVASAERVAITGPSGSGKTTLLRILAGLEVPSGGRVVVAGLDLARIGRRERDAYRRGVVGYVWQRPSAGLLAGISALDNVQVPMLAADGSRERPGIAAQLLEALGLGDQLATPPERMAPEQIRRLALAVALANRPPLLLADEVTAGLEWAAGRQLLEDLCRLLDDLGTAALLVGHEVRVQRYVDRVVVIRDGVALAAEATW